jgi:hypothetical protein
LYPEAFLVFVFFLVSGHGVGVQTSGFDEMQVFKTKAEVGVFFADWQAKKMGKTGFCDLENCIKQLSQQDEEELLEHVTKVNKTDVEFNTCWTKDPTHVLGSSLYTDLREWLGAGEWCCVSGCVVLAGRNCGPFFC